MLSSAINLKNYGHSAMKLVIRLSAQHGMRSDPSAEVPRQKALLLDVSTIGSPLHAFGPDLKVGDVSNSVATAYAAPRRHAARNGAVRLSLLLATSSGVPQATTWPPAGPASGPMSRR